MIALAAPLMRFLDWRLGDQRDGDPVAAARYRDFVVTRLGAGLAGAVAFPVWLACGAPGHAFAALAFAWLGAPLVIAALVMRGADLRLAYLFSAAAQAGLILWLTLMTGGLASPMLVWLTMVPAEAATSGDRRTVSLAGAIAAAGLALAAAAQLTGIIAAVPQWTTGEGAITAMTAAALIYLAVVALRLVGLQRTGEILVVAGEERYRLVAEHTADLVTRHCAGGEVEFASPAARRLLGTRPADLLRDGLFRLVHVADRPAYLTVLSAALREGRMAAVDLRLRRRGEPGRAEDFVWVEMCCWPSSPGGDRPAESVVAVTRDISERKAREAALAEAREAADAANAAKSRFLAQVSHELRTPLNAILGFSEILANDGVVKLERSRFADYARMIRQSSEHLLQVVNDLLDMSKIEAGKLTLSREPFGAGTMVESCVALMNQQAADRGLAISAEVEPDLPEFDADHRACRQILINLIANAIKFSPAGGRIAVGARLAPGAIQFQVSDQGIGIDEAHIPRLGTPFFQVDSDYNRQYQGTGLGLSVVKGLVALHGGEVAFDSAPGVGTTVTVRLPLSDRVAAPSPERRARTTFEERKSA